MEVNGRHIPDPIAEGRTGVWVEEVEGLTTVKVKHFARTKEFHIVGADGQSRNTIKQVCDAIDNMLKLPEKG